MTPETARAVCPREANLQWQSVEDITNAAVGDVVAINLFHRLRGKLTAVFTLIIGKLNEHNWSFLIAGDLRFVDVNSQVHILGTVGRRPVIVLRDQLPTAVLADIGVCLTILLGGRSVCISVFAVLTLVMMAVSPNESDHRGFTIHELDENGKSVPVEYEAIWSDASHLRVHRITPKFTLQETPHKCQAKTKETEKKTIDWMGCVRQNRATWLPLKSVIQKLTPSLHAPHGPVAAPATVPIGVRSAAFQSDTLSPEKFVIRIR